MPNLQTVGVIYQSAANGEIGPPSGADWSYDLTSSQTRPAEPCECLLGPDFPGTARRRSDPTARWWVSSETRLRSRHLNTVAALPCRVPCPIIRPNESFCHLWFAILASGEKLIEVARPPIFVRRSPRKPSVRLIATPILGKKMAQGLRID
jgi:hypothetical protein